MENDYYWFRHGAMLFAISTVAGASAGLWVRTYLRADSTQSVKLAVRVLLLSIAYFALGHLFLFVGLRVFQVWWFRLTAVSAGFPSVVALGLFTGLYTAHFVRVHLKASFREGLFACLGICILYSIFLAAMVFIWLFLNVPDWKG